MRYKQKFLLLKRSNRASNFQGKWQGVAGSIKEKEEPLAAARKSIFEETGLKEMQFCFVRTNQPFHFESEEYGIVFVIHPFLFEAFANKIKPNWEHDSCKWVFLRNIHSLDLSPIVDRALVALGLLKKEELKKKRILPSLRPKKRYLLFRFSGEIPKTKTNAFDVIKKQLSLRLGRLVLSEGKINLIEFNSNTGKGLLRVSLKYYLDARRVLNSIKEKNFFCKTIKASGSVKKLIKTIRIKRKN